MSTYNRSKEEKTGYTDEQVAILKQTSLHAVLEAEGRNVKSTPSGNYFSPFRTDTHPSFHIDERKHVFYDHGEGEGGTVIDLVMRLKGCSFREALDYLAAFHPSITPLQRQERTSPAATSSALTAYTLLYMQPTVIEQQGGKKVWEELGKRYGASVEAYYSMAKPDSAIIVASSFVRVPSTNGRQLTATFEATHKLMMKEAMERGIPLYFYAAKAWEKLSAGETAVSSIAGIPGGESDWYELTQEGEWKACEAPLLSPVTLVNYTTSDEAEPVILDILKRTIAENLHRGETPSALESVTHEDGRALSASSIFAMSLAAEARAAKLGIDISPRTVIPFVYEGKSFQTQMHWFAWNMAKTAGDADAAEKILRDTTAETADSYLKNNRTNEIPERLAAEWSATGIHLAAISNPDLRDHLLSLKEETSESVFDDGHADIFIAAAIDEAKRLRGLSVDDQGEYQGKGQIEITRIKEGVPSKILSEYEVEGRGIHPAVLNHYCFQADYKVTRHSSASGETETRHFSATAFPNRSGGWALKGSPYTTGSGAQKPGIKRSTGQDCTFIDRNGSFLIEEGAFGDLNGPFTIGDAPSADNVVVFEGFNDFLAWQTWRETLAPENTDVVVLNSVVNLGRALPFILSHKSVHAYMDNDEKGKETTQKLREAVEGEGLEFNDNSGVYSKGDKYGDLNDYWIAVSRKRKERGQGSRLDRYTLSRCKDGSVQVVAPSEGKSEGQARDSAEQIARKPSHSIKK